MITVFLTVLVAYIAIGVVFALAFVTKGIAVIDEVARSAPLRVRILLLPGSVALWPILLMRWLKGRRA
ncbi:MAG: hypothetical protein AAGB51_09170 [Planctomycetota bacterium]